MGRGPVEKRREVFSDSQAAGSESSSSGKRTYSLAQVPQQGPSDDAAAEPERGRLRRSRFVDQQEAWQSLRMAGRKARHARSRASTISGSRQVGRGAITVREEHVENRNQVDRRWPDQGPAVCHPRSRAIVKYGITTPDLLPPHPAYERDRASSQPVADFSRPGNTTIPPLTTGMIRSQTPDHAYIKSVQAISPETQNGTTCLHNQPKMPVEVTG